ncbi:hypothetical protein GALL_116230 [mine drainage metagenome]|uniref:HNH endonuclease 5 domain-containing protein n=1 Tax=mine drainage metagenome TaxID=410659 RepID=A0A1J5SCR2_9ZZZZ
MAFCLLCGKPLDHATPPEHVLLDCLGGRKKSKRLLCRACNRHLGATVDAALARAVAPFRAAHHLPSGSRNRWPDGPADPRPPRCDDAVALAAIAKMGLLLWAQGLGAAEMRRPCWQAARRRLAQGGPPPLAATPLTAPATPLNAGDFGPLAHRLWGISDAAGRVVAGASLYGQPGISLELCPAGAAPERHLLLLADPRRPAHWAELAPRPL